MTRFLLPLAACFSAPHAPEPAVRVEKQFVRVPCVSKFQAPPSVPCRAGLPVWLDGCDKHGYEFDKSLKPYDCTGLEEQECEQIRIGAWADYGVEAERWIRTYAWPQCTAVEP